MFLNSLGDIGLTDLMNRYGKEWAAIPEPHISNIQRRFQPGLDPFQSGVFGGDYGFKPHGTFGGRVVWKTSLPGIGDSLVVSKPDGSENLSTYLSRQHPGFYPDQFQDGAPIDAFEEVAVRDDERGQAFYFVRVKPSVASRYDLVDAGSETGDRYYLRLREPNQWSGLPATHMQVTRNPHDWSWLSIGAAGGYRDPRLLTFDARYGVITPRDNHLADKDTFWEVWGGTLTVFAAAAAGAALTSSATSAAGAGSGAAETAGGWVSAEGGAGYIGGAAADASALSVASTAPVVESGWISAEGGAGYAAGAPVDVVAATAPVTESGWVSAEGGAGYSGGSPVDAAAVAPSGYQSMPSPPSSSPSPTSTPSTPSTTSTPSPATASGSGSSSLWPSTSTIQQGVNVAKSLYAASQAGDKPAASTLTTRQTFSPPSPAHSVESVEMVTTPEKGFNWWWLLVVGATGYALTRKRKRGKHALQLSK